MKLCKDIRKNNCFIVVTLAVLCSFGHTVQAIKINHHTHCSQLYTFVQTLQLFFRISLRNFILLPSFTFCSSFSFENKSKTKHLSFFHSSILFYMHCIMYIPNILVFINRNQSNSFNSIQFQKLQILSFNLMPISFKLDHWFELYIHIKK